MKNKNSAGVLRLRPLIASLLFAFSVGAPAWAGLGALRVLSSADEAFYAEIPVEPEPGLISPNAILAPPERYSMLGPYSAASAQLAIKTREVSPGNFMVSISGPVLARDENFHFALELSWASGRVVREYHIPAGSRLPHAPDKKSPAPLAPPSEKPTLMSGAEGLSLGDGRLLSARGVPLRAQFELLGDWPQSHTIASQFSLAQVEGLAAPEHHHFDVRQRKGRLWLHVSGTQPVTAPHIAFDVQAQLDGVSVVRHFSFFVPKANKRHLSRMSPASPATTAKGYRIKAGDTLSRLAQRYGGAAIHPWMDEVFARNAHAFAHGDRNLLFAGAWLVFPDALPPAATTFAANVEAPAAPPPPSVAASAPPVTPAHATAASVPVAAKAAAMPVEDSLIHQRLKDAQQRMQWLESEINRLTAQPATQHAASAALPASAGESAFLDENLTEWLLTGVGGLSVASLLAWILWRRRRQEQVPAVSMVTLAPAVTVSEVLPVGERPLPQPVAGDINIDVIDAVAEADVLMAYGRTDAAEALLRKALHAEPAREDLRMKLLDLVARKGNKGAFEEVALDVLAMFGPASGLWGRVQQLGEALDPENPLYLSGKRPPGTPFVLDSSRPDPLPAVYLSDDQLALMAPLPPAAADFSANDQRVISVASALPQGANIEELARLYREMGDSETADTLLRDAGLLEVPTEAINIT